MKDFADKNLWAVILGGSSGLGLASAKKLAKHGMNICIVHRDPRAQLEKIQREFEDMKEEGVELIAFNKDAIQAEKRTELIGKIQEALGTKGKIRILLHSIAKGNVKPMISELESTLKGDDFLQTLNAMAVSLYDWTLNLHTANLFAKDARVLSFTSEGNTKAWKYYAAVSAAKVTLEAITRNIALEFAPFGIRANCIQAGVTNTASLQRIPGSEQLKEHSIQRNPLGKLTTPEDVANVVYLLSKEEARWINGTIVKVDGGESLN